MAHHTVEAVEVPSLFGLTFEDAATTLAGLGLDVALLPDSPAPQPGATVAGSIPWVGELAIHRSAVTLTFLPEPTDLLPPPTVPDVIGMDETRAQQVMEAAGYNVVGLGIYDQHTPAGMVIFVSPAGGTPLDPGQWVTVGVSLGPGGPGRRWIPAPKKTELPPIE